MAFKIDMEAAARRNLEAAEVLNGGTRRDVAGYLYGIAAECAIKALMREAGLFANKCESDTSNPFYKHFPELRTLIKDAPAARTATTLMRLIQDDSFMNNWAVSIRYTRSGEISNSGVDQWARQARNAVTVIGT